VAAEEVAAQSGVGVGFHTAELRVMFAELDGTDAGADADLGEVGARFGNKLVGEKVAVSVDKSETGRLVSHTFHNN
jgi:hypothetical protein